MPYPSDTARRKEITVSGTVTKSIFRVKNDSPFALRIVSESVFGKDD